VPVDCPAADGYTATVKALKYLNPILVRNVVRDVRRGAGGGGPRAVRLLGLTEPQGIFIPVTTATIELERRDGRVERFEPTLPVPFPYAWIYRVAKALRVPIVRSVDPQRIRFQVPVPGRGGGEDADESLEDAASPADRVTSAEEEAEDRSRDERAELLQDEAERLEESVERADDGDAEELRQATERARAERRTVERG
jgi:hypothetical protein